MDCVLPDTTWPVLVPDDTAGQRALAFAVAAKRRLFSLAGVQPPETPPVSNDHMRDALASANYNIDIQSYYGSPRGLSRAMGSLDAQVVLPSMMSLGPHFPHPWIGYRRRAAQANARQLQPPRVPRERQELQRASCRRSRDHRQFQKCGTRHRGVLSPSQATPAF